MEPGSEAIRLETASYIEQEGNLVLLEKGIRINQPGLFRNDETFDRYYDCAQLLNRNQFSIYFLGFCSHRSIRKKRQCSFFGALPYLLILRCI